MQAGAGPEAVTASVVARMAFLRKNLAAPTIHVVVDVVFLLMMVAAAQAQDDPFTRLAIGNSFRSPTEITCRSDKQTRNTYYAGAYEIFYFSFETSRHQFWDCDVSNRGWIKAGTFRFWGDAGHGGAAFGACTYCNWNVDEFGVSFDVDGAWKYKYFWRTATHG